MTFEDVTSQTNALGLGFPTGLREPFALVLESELFALQVSHLEGEVYLVRLSERSPCHPGFLWRTATRSMGITLAHRLAELLETEEPGKKWERLLAPSLRRTGTWGGLITESSFT